jgi:hypothetical protein
MIEKVIGNVRKALGVPQNLGWLDRVIRLVLGCALLGVPWILLGKQTTVASWHSYAMILSIYPFLTGILGWDPIYSLFGAKTCGTSERNPCGTLPYEVDAALGHHPIPDSDIEHSLKTSHHEKSKIKEE